MFPNAFQICALTVLIADSSLAQKPANGLPKPANETDGAGKLAVKRVVLYKNGVGYFEHLGKVRDNQSVAVSFTSGQLDDVLKSLTVLDLDGGRITGVTYGSSASLERQLADLRLSTGEKTTLTEFIGALRGARIEVRSGASMITGRLLSVDRKTRTGGGATLEVDYLSLVTDAGELKTTELTTGFSVRLLDSGLSGTVGKYLDLVSMSREPDQRNMTIATSGSGDRRLFVSYISEAPVWKATYRIVLPSKAGQSPLLQGWAIVDNTGAQDWENVELSLVAGAPQSFIQKLSQPYYSRRPVVPIKESLSAVPQTFEAPLLTGGARLTGIVRDASGAAIAGALVKVFDPCGNVLNYTVTDAQGKYAVDSLPDGTMRLEVESPGFGKAAQFAMLTAGQLLERDVQLQVGSTPDAVEVTADASKQNVMRAAQAIPGNTGTGRTLGSGTGLGHGAVGAGSGGGFGPGSGGGMGGGVFRIGGGYQRPVIAQDLGDLFEYKLKEPITIRKSQSALVPILQANVTAEKVSIWNDRAGLSKPQRALWLENSSGSTLDGGSFSVLESDTFAGEGIFDSIRPGEKRLISYAVDLAITSDTKDNIVPERVTRARVNKGVFTVVKERLESKTYTFRNADSSARTILVEHPARKDYALRSEVQPVETSSGWMRFRLEVPARQTSTLRVEEAQPVEATYQVASITDEQVELFVREKSIDKQLEDSLRKVIAQRAVVVGLGIEKNMRDEESTKIYDDQQRLRENIKALKGSAEEKALLQRYTKQLNDQEDRLAQLKKEIGDLEVRQAAAQEELNRLTQAMSFDIKL